MATRIETIGTELEDGTKVNIEATVLKGEEVISDILPFTEVTDAIESIAKSVMATLERVRPHKATVEFGIEIGVDSGKLTAVVIKGTGSANMKITLEWEGQDFDNKAKSDDIS